MMDTQLAKTAVMPKSLSSNDLVAMQRQVALCPCGLGPEGVEPSQLLQRDRCSPCPEEHSLKPIKRSRSDQNLTSGSAAPAVSQPLSVAAQWCPVRHAAGAERLATLATLPAILSDMGSTDSCTSMDSDTTRSTFLASRQADLHGGTNTSGPPAAATVTIVTSSSAVSLTAGILQRVTSSEASDNDMPESSGQDLAPAAAGSAAIAAPMLTSPVIAAAAAADGLSLQLVDPASRQGSTTAAGASSLRRMSSADAPATARPTPSAAPTFPVPAFGFHRHQQPQQPYAMGFGSAAAAARQAFGAQPFGMPMAGHDSGRVPPSGRAMRIGEPAAPSLFALGEDGPVLAPLRVKPQQQTQYQRHEQHHDPAARAAPAAASSQSRAGRPPLSPPRSPHAGAAAKPPSAVMEDEWSFQHRTSTSGSGSGALSSPHGVPGSAAGRRRSSLEVSMPWRAQLERAIAAAAAASSSSAPDSPMTTSDHSSANTDVNSDDEAPDGVQCSGSFVMPAGAESERPELERRPSRRQQSYLEHGSAAQELFLRLNRARQTLDFTKRQAAVFAELDQAELSIWEALELTNELSECEAALVTPGPGEEPLDPNMPMMEHAFQVAELCRLAFPDKDWMHLVGLIHGLGKLLTHTRFGLQPPWAVCGETYPLGVKFAPQISNFQFFSANPDRRRRAYSTPVGVYQPKCGLRNVYMSWGAPEYLYIVLVLNQVQLPDEALFMIRNQKFLSLTRPGNAYRNLLSNDDVALLPLLSAFQRLSVYRRVELPADALKGQAFRDYYQRLINKYLGDEKLFW